MGTCSTIPRLWNCILLYCALPRETMGLLVTQETMGHLELMVPLEQMEILDHRYLVMLPDLLSRSIKQSKAHTDTHTHTPQY